MAFRNSTRALLVLVAALGLAACEDDDGGPAAPPPPPAPTVDLGASLLSVVQGATTQLTWTSTNATTCTASGGWTGNRATSGTETSAALATVGITNFVLSCTGAGGTAQDTVAVTVTAAPGVTEVQLTDVFDPAAVVKIAIADGPTAAGVQQLEGPALGGLDYTAGQLSFVSPPDSGVPYTLKFRLGGDTTRVFRLDFVPRAPPPVEAFGEEGDAGVPASSPTSSELSATITGLVNDLILPANFSTLAVQLRDAAGPVNVNPDDYEVYLSSPTDYQSVKALFTLSGSTLTLAPASLTAFQALIGRGRHALEFSGADAGGRYFSFELSFFHGVNQLDGRILNTGGTAVTNLPANATVAVRGLANGLTLLVTPAAGGLFTVADLPTDSYELSLVDPSGQFSGAALFGIDDDGVTVDVDLVVFGGVAGKSGSRSSVSSTARESPRGDLRVAPPSRSKSVPARTVTATAPRPQPKADTLGEVFVEGGTQDVTITDVEDVVIAQGTGIVRVVVQVDSTEFPTFTTNPDNPYNDSWRYAWTCGGFGDTASGRVNVTHATTGARSFDRQIDLTSATANGAITCRIEAYTANIGDSGVPTSVRVAIEGNLAPTLSIKEARHRSGLFADILSNYYMGVPIQTGAPGTRRPFEIEVEYLPITATIQSMRLDLGYTGSEFAITANQAFTKVKDGLLRATVTLPGLAINPSGNQFASLRVRLSGTLANSAQVVTTEIGLMKLQNNKDVFVPLFETRNRHATPDSRRYQSSASDPRQDSAGGDGWGRVAMLNFLHGSGEGGSLVFNDVSGEHAWQANNKSLGVHTEHKGGADVDARYKDENGAYLGEMRGDGNGATIKSVLDAAQLEVSTNAATKPNLVRARNWITTNRTFLESVASASGVKKVLVGIQAWHRNALERGRFPDGTNIPTDALDGNNQPIPLGIWNKPSNVKPSPGNHEGHIHVSFD